jgi:uncharacterized protein (DUF2147 family)
MISMFRAILFLGLVAVLQAADLSSPVGLWKTIDDKTGKPRGIIRIYEQNGLFFGKIEKGLDPARQESRTCNLCKDERKDQPMLGLVIIRNMKLEGGEYRNGDILDPDNGGVYKCKLRLTDGGKKLLVRGFVGFSMLGRTQTWLRE